MWIRYLLVCLIYVVAVCSPVVVISPNYGNQLGGTPVIIKGPFFNENDIIQCVFGSSDPVPGARVNEMKALCILPSTSKTGNVEFVLKVNGTLIGSATFYLQSFYDLADVLMVTNDYQFLVQSNISVLLQWHSDSIFPLAPTSSYTVDIEVHRLDSSWNTILLPDHNNTGIVNVSISSEAPNTFIPIAFKVVANVSQSSEDDSYIMALKEIYNSQSDNISTTAGRWSHVIVWRTTSINNTYCNNWKNSDLWGSANVIGEEFPACPCNVLQAELPNSNFKQNQSPGRRLLDQFLHSNISRCYVSTNEVTILGSGATRANQECCYDKNGYLSSGLYGGHQLRNVPNSFFKLITWLDYFNDNIAPYIGCCITSNTPVDCNKYYMNRPSSNCNGFSPATTSFAYGDPHLVTLDGLRYTFNGKGEFILVKTQDDLLTIQGRMVPATNSTGGQSLGTVFSAIAAQQNDSDTIEFQPTSIGIRTLVNGELVIVPIEIQAQYTNVIIINKGNNTYRAVFSSGASLEVKQENGFLARLTVSLSATYLGIVSGLLGLFNGYEGDDLLPRGGIPLPRDPSPETIHYEFGLTWLISNSSESLFAYDPLNSFSTFYDPSFVPVFRQNFTDPILEAEANATCQGDNACLFDIAVTGRVEIGMSTLEQVHIIENIRLLSQPIICNTPCVQGACVDTNICNCPYGFEGDLCEIPIVFSCGQSNPCQNNANCTIEMFTYICTCSPPYTGVYCETVDCGPPPNASPPEPPLFVANNNTIAGSIAVYSCMEGYVINGETESICLDNATWSEVNPQCIVDCGDLYTNDTELIINYNSTTVGSLVHYNCATPENYTLIGNRNRTCMLTGQWSGMTPYCKSTVLADCGPPVVPSSHVLVTSNSTLAGSVAVYSCVSGYVLLGDQFTKCQENGVWTQSYPRCTVDCGIPSLGRDPNLQVEIFGSTIATSVAKYRCKTGYVLVGNSFSECLINGSWSGPIPQCLKFFDCGEPPVWNSGVSVQYNGTAPGSVAIYYCENQDHVLVDGNETALCLDDGTWQSEFPYCKVQEADHTVYIVVSATFAGVIILTVLVVLIIVFIGISCNRFRATFVVSKETYQLSEI